jgi:hypothetical protein
MTECADFHLRAGRRIRQNYIKLVECGMRKQSIGIVLPQIKRTRSDNFSAGARTCPATSLARYLPHPR